MTLKSRVIHGLSWSFISRIGMQVFQFGFGVVLARTLSPVEFGVFGMLVIFTGFAITLSDGGLNSALIHKQGATEADKSTVFWLQLMLGVGLTVLFFACAHTIARFYELPDLAPLTQLAASVFVIQSIGQTHYALYMKEFRFRALAIANVISTAVSGAVAVGLALEGFGVWALAWQAVTVAIVNCALYWLQSDWRPRFMFSIQSAVELGRYAIYLLGHGTVNYWLRNADNLVVGKFIGAEQLGVYARAYSLMLLPLNNLAAVVGQVMFPALAEMQGDLPRFRRTFLTATQMIAFITFPTMFGLALLADPFIILVYGIKWAQVVPILQVLSFVGLFQSIVFPVAWVFNALGQTRTQFNLSLICAVIFAIAIAIGMQWGAIGVAWGYATCALITGLLVLHVAGGYIGLSLGTVLASVGRTFATASAMAVVVLLLDQQVLGNFSNLIRLMGGVICGVIVYVGLCWVSADPTFKQLAETGIATWRGKKAGVSP